MRQRSVQGETWIEDEWPYDGRRRGFVRFPDGKLKTVRLAQTADTFFTIRARPSHGESGYVSTCQNEAGENEFCFNQYGSK